MNEQLTPAAEGPVDLMLGPLSEATEAAMRKFATACVWHNLEGRTSAAEDLRAAIRAEAAGEIERLRAEVGAKQAQIDRLMLEYCSDEMTPAQLVKWGLHQQPAHIDRPTRHYDRTCPGCADEPNVL